MSRSNVFSRIATWLKDAANLNELRLEKEAQANMRRRYTVQTLEDRQMLDASFAFNAVTEVFTINNFSEFVEESMTLTETPTEYRFVLSEGTWTGINGFGITGNGTNDLRINKLIPFEDPTGPIQPPIRDTLFIDDDIGVNMHFTGANYNDWDFFVIDTNRGEITQETLTRVLFDNLSVNGAETLLLDQIGNDIGNDTPNRVTGRDLYTRPFAEEDRRNGFLTVTDTNTVHVQDQDILRLSTITVNGNAILESDALLIAEEPVTIGGNLLLNSNRGDIRQANDAPIVVQGTTNLKSNDRITPDPSLDEYDRPRIWLDFGDGDGDGLNDNDFVGMVTVEDGSDVEIRDKNDILLGDITTDFNRFTQLNQIYIEAENGTITMDGTIIARGNDVNDDNPNDVRSDR